MSMDIGLRGKAEITVAFEHTAAAMGSGAMPVLATPFMIALMEKAAATSVKPFLGDGEGTVGTRVDVAHLAATPIGGVVTVESELVSIDRRRLTFKVAARCGDTLIGAGTHERFIIQNDRFMEKLK